MDIDNNDMECACRSRRKTLHRWRLLLLLGVIATPGIVAAQPKLAIDLDVYPYLDRVQDDTDVTLTINARLPARFSYFSYMNFGGVLADGDSEFLRSEQNIRWSVAEHLPIDLNLQALLIGNANNYWLLGVGWRVHDTSFLKDFFDRINLIYRLTVQFKRFSSDNDNAWQLEHYFRMTFPGISERLYLNGFVDQTFNLGLPDTFPTNPVVTEVQLGLRMFSKFYAVTEYRVNQFRLGNEHNLAVGIEYQFRW